ncbi:MAG: hypothetical protein LIO55_08315 [Oscillospiraceae bacterium]|nr:hypothetical protein [Oscillospiraceae bacterium]
MMRRCLKPEKRRRTAAAENRKKYALTHLRSVAAGCSALFFACRSRLRKIVWNSAQKCRQIKSFYLHIPKKRCIMITYVIGMKKCVGGADAAGRRNVFEADFSLSPELALAGGRGRDHEVFRHASGAADPLCTGASGG